MRRRRPTSRAVAGASSLPCAEALEHRTLLASHTWTGAVNNNWSNVGNWVGGAPAVGESDVAVHFNTVDATVNQNIAGLTIHQLWFDLGSQVTLTLNQTLTVSGDGTILGQVYSRTAGNVIDGAGGLVLTRTTGGEMQILVETGGSLDVAVGVSGNLRLLKTGAGTLRLSGAVANTNEGGLIAYDGDVLLAKPAGVMAVTGELHVNGISGSPTVRLEASNQIADDADVLTNRTALFDLNGFEERIHELLIFPDLNPRTQVTTGTGGMLTPTVGVQTYLAAPAGTVTLSGRIQTLDAAFRILTVLSRDVVIDGRIVGPGGVTKTGPGFLEFTGSGNSTYEMPTTVLDGELRLNKGGGGTAVPGALSIGNAANATTPELVLLQRSNQIADASAVTVLASGMLDLAGCDDVVGSIEGASVNGPGGTTVGGRVALGTAAAATSHLTVGGLNAPTTFAGTFTGFGRLSKTGTGALTLSGATSATGVVFHVADGGGSLVLNATQRVASMIVGDGATATLGATPTPGTRALVTSALTINPTGRLDLTNGGMIFDYDPGPGNSPLAGIRAALTVGHAGGAWTGFGITSSSAAAVADKSVGYAENNAAVGGLGKTRFLGQDVDASSVLIRFTFDGDADLDGSVGAGDFNLLATHFGLTNRVWQTGDFDYDQTTGPGDFNLLAVQFGKSLPVALIGEGGAAATLTEKRIAPRRPTRAAAAPLRQSSKPLEPTIVVSERPRRP